eukprot:gene19069-24891_t
MSTPELKQKKIERDARLAQEAEDAAIKATAEEEQLIKDITARTQTYEEEYIQLERTAIDSRREAKANSQIFVPAEEKVVFVIRIRGINGVSPKVKKILQLFRLRQIHNGVFVKVNSATIKMLRLVEPYIAYGYPNLKSVRALVYKRGFGKLNGQRIPLSSNKVIQAGLGHLGIQAVEDIVHEIYTEGPNFKAVSNFLWPFKLTSPRGGYTGKKLNHFAEGGSCGQQGVKINKLIKKTI